MTWMQPTDFQVFRFFIWHYREFPILTTTVIVMCIIIAALHDSLVGVALFTLLLFIYVPAICLVVYWKKRDELFAMYRGQQMADCFTGPIKEVLGEKL